MRAIAIVDISEPSVQTEFTALANLCGVWFVVALSLFALDTVPLVSSLMILCDKDCIATEFVRLS